MQNPLNALLDSLLNLARKSGADDAKIIAPETITIEDEIIDLCRTPFCPGYGQSAHCPPHALKPAAVRKIIEKSRTAVIFKRNVDPQILLSDKKDLEFRKIYEIAADLETYARENGYRESTGFAAGSCLPVFCKNKACRVIAADQPCRFPALARPSMEAVGINVFKMVKAAGWEIQRITRDSDPDGIPGGVLAGLVLIGE